MTISIEEAKAFVTDATKARDNWLVMAERSWNEIKKRQKNAKLWSVTPNSVKKRARYPAWYSIFKIRQPLLLSRIGIPIGKDTTQDGNDPIGATAAICLERLAINLARSFDFFDVMSSARDDFLATNIGFCRAYYEREEVKERVKIRLTPQQIDEQNVVFIGPDGQQVLSDAIAQDDEGFYLETDEVVDVENERICLEPVLYKDVFIDPDIRRWNRCKRIAFLEYYSEREFKRLFGSEAFAKLPKSNDQNPGKDEASPKRQTIKVYEYWDEYEEECLWFADQGTEFIKPLTYPEPDEDMPRRGLYDLEKFFPVPNPLISNQATDEFWPIPEFYQLQELLEDIHTIFSRMVALTRAIRARLLFDSNIEGLQPALNEASEGDAFGVSNLTQALAGAGGSLDGVVQYIPVLPLVESLNQVYTALEQRLNTLYKLTGTSDLLQGLITDPTQRTFGERQMTEKYALNQLAEPQRKMQEFVRDSYQLMCEMALKNFKDDSLTQYIIPRTLQPEQQEVYPQAIELLQNNQKRFRIELETDSTIALNEEYDKAMRIELVNTLTTALEKTAQIAQSSPALVITELHCLKYLIQGFRQGKMFQNEVTQAIDNIIEAAKDTPAPFNKDEAQTQMKGQEMQMNAQMKQYEITSRERVEMFRIQQDSTFKQLHADIEVFKAQSSASIEQGKLQQKYEELVARITQAQEDMDIQRNALVVRIREITDKKEATELATVMEAQNKAHDANIKELMASLSVRQQDVEEMTAAAEIQDHKVSLAERVATENRLEEEHKLNKAVTMVDVATKMRPEAPAPQAPAKKKQQVKVKKDKNGNVSSFEALDEQS
jgi:hypothetical protein